MTLPVPQVLSWPMGGVNEKGQWSFSSDDESVREVIRNILLTRPGERVMRPKFGAGLLDFIHQPNNHTTRNVMAGVIHKAIEQWETRVSVESVEVLPAANSLSTVQIIIRYQMRYSGQKNQLSLGLELGQF